MDLPQAIGDCVTIPAYDYELRREVEAHGFWPKSGTPQYLVMRRDFPAGTILIDLPRLAPVFVPGDLRSI